MAWFDDLSPWTYYGDEPAQFLRAVGWLERGKPFQIIERDQRVYEKLIDLSSNPWQPAASGGYHACDLCIYKSEMHGNKNLFIPNGTYLYVCPELILHYMNAHGYGPPQEFCEAVLGCPAMRSIDYHKLLLASGGRPLVQLSGNNIDELQ